MITKGEVIMNEDNENNENLPFGLQLYITIGKDGLGDWIISTKENKLEKLPIEELKEILLFLQFEVKATEERIKNKEINL